MSKEQKVSGLTPIPVEQIAFGIRFQPRYEVVDHVGTVIDRILRSTGTPFGPEVFPYSEREAGQHRLINPTTGDQLTLTHSDAVLEMKVDSRKTSDIELLADGYATFVLDGLLEVVKLRDIVRYGVLFKLQECRSAVRETPVEHFLQRDFQDAHSMSLRFTRRLGVEEALIRKGVNDFRNIIYTVKQNEEGEVKIWVDYQEIFEPELDAKEWAQKPFKKFVGRGIDYFLGPFQEWLIKLIEKDEAA
jgi:hypothetical protein